MAPNQYFPYRLYLVTDQEACLGKDFFWVVEEAVKGGVDIVQIREKILEGKAFYKKAEQLKMLLDQYQVPLIINDQVPLAVEIQAAGVHIGQSDAPFLQARQQLSKHQIIGLSLESMDHLHAPEAEQADYLALSPVFATPTKTNTVIEWGLSGIRQVRQLTDKPLVAIGSIKEQNAGDIIAHGADCIAVVSAICSAKSPAKAAERLRNTIEQHL